MNLYYHRYTLVPRRRLSGLAREGAREGALIRWNDGFADVHPWPELGDAPLDEQLVLLRQGKLTRLTKASLKAAAWDGGARKLGKSLFEGLTIPESHWPGPDPPPGFDTVKLKSAHDLPEGVRLRVDLNATLTAAEFLELAKTLPCERIDFIEDPCPYDHEVWTQIRERTGLRLALDRDLPEEPEEPEEPRNPRNPRNPIPDVLVHKPALSTLFPEFDGEIVVTSYMDHPVGQFGAAYVAATNRVSARCGLMTHVLYEPDAFIERIGRDGARLLPPGGTGIGFDDLLESLPWQTLR